MTMRPFFQSALALAFLSLIHGAALAQAAAPNARTQVQDVVRAYVDASNKVDITAAMELMSRRPEVSSVEDGNITRGWDAIRQAADEMLGMEGRFKVAVGSMDVTLLGAANALVVAPTTITIVDDAGQTVQVKGALSLVLERVQGAWKILHEHHSIRAEQ